MGSSPWNNCFLCCSRLRPSRRRGGPGKGSTCGDKEKTEFSGSSTGAVHNKRSSAKQATFFKYLLDVNKSQSQSLLKDILRLTSSTEGSTIKEECPEKRKDKLCSRCGPMVDKVADLHERLEVIQMQIVNVMKAAKEVVMRNSHLYGTNSEVKETVRKVEDWIAKRQEGGEGGGEMEEKVILKVLNCFQTLLFESDAFCIPLVYLRRVSIIPEATTTSCSTASASRHRRRKYVRSADTVLKVKAEPIPNDNPAGTPHDEFLEVLGNEFNTPSPSPVSPVASPLPLSRARKKRRLKISSKFAEDDDDFEVDDDEQEDSEASSISDTEKRGRGRPEGKKDTKKRVITPGSRQKSDNSPKKISKRSYKESDVSETFHLRQELMKKFRTKQKAIPKSEKARESQKRLTCFFCPFASLQSFVLEAHLREKHETDEKNFGCPECALGFTTEQYFTMHMKRHGGAWKCDVCSTEVVPIKMNSHLRSHPEVDVLHTCQFCDRSYGKLLSYVNHIRHHTGTTILCPLCPQRLPEAPDDNSLPPQEFRTRFELPSHLYEFHGLSEFLLTCDEPNCTRSFFELSVLLKHKRSHKPAFQCGSCEKRFTCKSSLDHHFRVVHTTSTPFKCDECSAEFKYDRNLLSHKIREHAAQRFECHICQDKTFTSQCGYDMHMWINHKLGKPREYVCTICSKVFPDAYRLKNHQAVHSEERNFTCEICGFAVKTRTVLKRHIATHGPKKPPKIRERKFDCMYCDKKFTQKRVLQDHIMIHTGEKPWVCQDCGRGFIQRTGLTSHRKNIHSAEILAAAQAAASANIALSSADSEDKLYC